MKNNIEKSNFLKCQHVSLEVSNVDKSLDFYRNLNQERQKKLEAQKISLKKEISQINKLISESKKRSKNLANDLEDLQLKISVRDKLININNSQLNNLTSIINNQNFRIAGLESDLTNLKTEYEKIIYNSYKKRSTQMKLMYLFASSTSSSIQSIEKSKQKEL